MDDKKLFVVHFEELVCGEICIKAQTEKEARNKGLALVSEADDSLFNWDSHGCKVVDVNETTKDEAEANGWKIAEESV